MKNCTNKQFEDEENISNVNADIRKPWSATQKNNCFLCARVTMMIYLN